MRNTLITNLELNHHLKDNKNIEARWVGSTSPEFLEIHGRKGLVFDGSGYLELASNLLSEVNDETGFTFSAWVFVTEGSSPWERIFDFGSGEGRPSVFLTRNFRATLSGHGDLVADGSKRSVENKWVHLTYVYTPTNRNSNSSAGGRVYIDGELVGDGLINQTTSGMFGRLKQWTQEFDKEDNFIHNYLGHSQYSADPDFKGILSDVSIFKTSLDEEAIFTLMAQTLEDKDIIEIAKNRDLDLGLHVVSENLQLPKTLFGGLVNVEYKSSNFSVLSDTGEIGVLEKPTHVSMDVKLSRNEVSEIIQIDYTVLPKDIAAYTLHVKKEKLSDVSEVMYGLFYEDINNAADGGIYAEMVRNRSFESFEFDGFAPNDNVCGCELGRTHDPLQAWYGDLEKVQIETENSLDDFLQLKKGVNSHYITLSDGTLWNKGYNDTTHQCAMLFKRENAYDFSFWAKGQGQAHFSIMDEQKNLIAQVISVDIDSEDWHHFSGYEFISQMNTLGQIQITVDGKVSFDNFSMMPQNVWGKNNETPTSLKNYEINKNYRLRTDLVQALYDLNPKFLRFPGGCISEGAFLWDNVFDWKQTIGDVEKRKENFNLWGYSMTMGLGYFEYFQLAEDLGSYPVPVMACGVLCQARSDYAAPAGGSLREYYIRNFTDLIDFAISEDFENNHWAKTRKDLGHPEPFKLHYLGVGNENWGDEFFANFEIFKHEINLHMRKYYPNHVLHIISTVGAQADDDAFQDGWRFLHGDHKGVDNLEFTDGKSLFNETIEWYKNDLHHMDTIADEHYYRTNDYLKHNVDRYNYYKRVYDDEGRINQEESSKVFVGEYASTDKNTLHGAISEAALMCGFENNADVVVMASYAPLFNKVLNDATYRWTPDLIWFDNEEVWFTPNYYNQKLFANNIGTKVLQTEFESFNKGLVEKRTPKGKVSFSVIDSEVLLRKITIISNKDQSILFSQDFSESLSDWVALLPEAKGYTISPQGLILQRQTVGINGIIINQDFEDYTLIVDAMRLSGDNALMVGVGISSIEPKNGIEYAVDYQGKTTGLRVFKDGVEGYRLGDFSTSVVAGNMRRSLHHPHKNNVNTQIHIEFGTKHLIAYSVQEGKEYGKLEVKNETYNKELFNTVSEDEEAVYIKLVNIDNQDKLIDIKLQDHHLESEAILNILDGSESLLDMSNVNEKAQERIKPRVEKLVLKDDTLRFKCTAHSINVIKIHKYKGTF